MIVLLAIQYYTALH